MIKKTKLKSKSKWHNVTIKLNDEYLNTLKREARSMKHEVLAANIVVSHLDAKHGIASDVRQNKQG